MMAERRADGASYPTRKSASEPIASSRFNIDKPTQSTCAMARRYAAVMVRAEESMRSACTMEREAGLRRSLSVLREVTAAPSSPEEENRDGEEQGGIDPESPMKPHHRDRIVAKSVVGNLLLSGSTDFVKTLCELVGRKIAGTAGTIEGTPFDEEYGPSWEECCVALQLLQGIIIHFRRAGSSCLQFGIVRSTIGAVRTASGALAAIIDTKRRLAAVRAATAGIDLLLSVAVIRSNDDVAMGVRELSERNVPKELSSALTDASRSLQNCGSPGQKACGIDELRSICVYSVRCLCLIAEHAKAMSEAPAEDASSRARKIDATKAEQLRRLADHFAKQVVCEMGHGGVTSALDEELFLKHAFGPVRDAVDRVREQDLLVESID